MVDKAERSIGSGDALEAGVMDAIKQALRVYDFSTESSVQLLNVSENWTYLIQDRSSQRQAVLRVHRPGYHTYEAIQSELAWVDALRSDGIVEAAAVLPDRDGRTIQTLDLGLDRPPRYAVLFQYLAGVEPKPDDAGLPGWFEKLGEITARLHRHARQWQRPEWFVRHDWDTDAMHGERHLWGPWEQSLGLTKEGRVVIAAAVTQIAEVLKDYGKDPGRYGLIHADLRLANLLVEGSHLKVLDFDDMGFSWFFYDFASAVSFFEDAPQIPKLLRSWLDGYSRSGNPQARDLRALPTLVIARRILLTAWVASHVDAPFPQQLGTSFTDDTVRLARRYLNGKFLGSL